MQRAKKIHDYNNFIISLDERQQMKNEDFISTKYRGCNDILNIIDNEFNKYYLSKQNKPPDHLLKIIKKFIQENKKEQVVINATIKNINDLLDLINTYKLEDNIEYNLNMKGLYNIKEPLHRPKRKMRQSKTYLYIL